MNPSQQQIIDSMPPSWQGHATFAIAAVNLLVAVGYFAANHGGLVGIAKAVLYGKPSNNSTP